MGRGGVAEGVTKGHEDFRDNRYIHYLSFADILWVYIIYIYQNLSFKYLSFIANFTLTKLLSN